MKLTQGNLTFMPTQDSVASQQELIVASGFYMCLFSQYLLLYVSETLMTNNILDLIKKLFTMFMAVCDNKLLIWYKC